MPGEFVEGLPLQLELIPGRYAKWRLQKRLVFNYTVTSSLGYRITVPKGYVTDLTSIPWWIPVPGKREGKWTAASILHDWLYTSGFYAQFMESSTARAYSDYMFLEALKSLDAGPLRRTLFYWGVRIGGWLGWRRNRRNDV